MKKYIPGFVLSLIIAVFSWHLGQILPVIGGPVFAILTGMLLAIFIKNRRKTEEGVNFVSRKVLQYAVILLGFGMDFSVVLETGQRSLPIIVSSITTSLVVAYILFKIMHVPGKIAALIGVGSSICGGSAIAAAAPVIDADNEEVAQSISVIFLFNLLAALFFPALGAILKFDITSGDAFGIFAGTAINDTSSVTAAASTWDSLYGLGSATMDIAVTVKLTRTLAIIPVTLVLAFYRAHKAGAAATGKINFSKIFPFFIFGFILTSIITTTVTGFGISADIFTPFKVLSKFMIVLAMGAVGLNTNVVKLVKTGGKPLLIGFCCWGSITVVSLIIQRVMGIW